MPKKAAPRSHAEQVALDFAFFGVLWRFYTANRRRIRSRYDDLTRTFLDFNDPDKGVSFLRRPQFEALEIYVFLKQVAHNKPVQTLFDEWHKGTGIFARDRSVATDREQQGNFLRQLDLQGEETYRAIFNRLRQNSHSYPNYVFALTMGTGKTLLMATCIFYDFLLANKHPKDPRFCHNVLVFAPDKTVLQSLQEIQTFDLSRVVPPPYANFLTQHLQFHFLDDAGMALATRDGSRFNIIISNTQKIILKQRHAAPTAAQRLFSAAGRPPRTVVEENADLYGDDQPETDEDLIVNARFLRLARLPQLGVFVDEAHHALGDALARNLGYRASETSLRKTIDRLATDLKRLKSRVVACYNYTGTPYVGEYIMPEVVYAYGLKDAIANGFLKRAAITGYRNARTADFVREVVRDFWASEGETRREGMLPKLAFFASSIDELEKELRPAVERTLRKLGVPESRILVNVGDPKLTSSDDIREFINLDTPESEKQFILLVNKGREGWNCRSLFGVALYRRPRSRIFVLQASMRCLRAIGHVQETGRIYVSEENLAILDDELQQNFRVTRADLDAAAGPQKRDYQVRMVPPPVRIRIKRVRHHFELKRKEAPQRIAFGFATLDTKPYELGEIRRIGLAATAPVQEMDISDRRERRRFSRLTLVAEIARYLNNAEVPCLRVEEMLASSEEGIDAVLTMVNRFTPVLYDVVIPALFRALFEIESSTETTDEEVELVKPRGGAGEPFQFRALPDLVVQNTDDAVRSCRSKSFHLDTYCFDSGAEVAWFRRVLVRPDVEKVYFTGMLTHNQSDFYITYVDPESHTVRKYFPDFFIRMRDGRQLIIEVKADNEVENPVVLAKKAYARQLAAHNAIEYLLIPATRAAHGDLPLSPDA